SACEVGLSKVRTGDEIIGLVAALLASGARTVIASVCRINDRSVPEVTIRYHQLLAGGTPPADALAAGCSATPSASFVCYGSGGERRLRVLPPIPRNHELCGRR